MTKAIMTTYSGRTIDLMDITQSDISIRDIAHHLALINRFCGASLNPISVAQHCIGVSRLCDPRAALQGLLHDASEAYLGDVVKWLKQQPCFQEYRELEGRIQLLIFTKFAAYNTRGELQQDESVTSADRLMVRYEAHRYMKRGIDVPVEQQCNYSPITPIEEDTLKLKLGSFSLMHWPDAEDQFLERFRDLTEV